MTFAPRTTQSDLISSDVILDTLPKDAPAVLNTLKELILNTTFDVPDGSQLEPKGRLSVKTDGSRYGVETKGYIEIEVLITFFDCELILKLPNHKNNLEYCDNIARNIRTGWDYLLPSGAAHKELIPLECFGIVGCVDVEVKICRP